MNVEKPNKKDRKHCVSSPLHHMYRTLMLNFGGEGGSRTAPKPRFSVIPIKKYLFQYSLTGDFVPVIPFIRFIPCCFSGLIVVRTVVIIAYIITSHLPFLSLPILLIQSPYFFFDFILCHCKCHCKCHCISRRIIPTTPNNQSRFSNLFHFTTIYHSLS